MWWVHYLLHGSFFSCKGWVRVYSHYQDTQLENSDTLRDSLGGGGGDGDDGVTQVDGDVTVLTSSTHASCSTGSGRRCLWPGIFIGSGLLAASQSSHTGAGARAGQRQPVPDQLIPRVGPRPGRGWPHSSPSSTCSASRRGWISWSSQNNNSHLITI